MSERRIDSSRAVAGRGPLRVRPPRPLTPSARLVLGVMALVVLVVAAVLLQAASAADRRTGRNETEIVRPLAPRGSSLDPFALDGSIGADGTLAWTVVEGAWTVRDGAARSSGATSDVAVVATGHQALVLDALVERARPGAGLILAEAEGDRLELTVDEQGTGWQVVRTLAGRRTIVQLVPGPTVDTVLQVIRRGNEIRVSFDRNSRTIELPGEAPTGRSVGLVAAGAGTAFDRFAYLPLDDA